MVILLLSTQALDSENIISTSCKKLNHLTTAFTCSIKLFLERTASMFFAAFVNCFFLELVSNHSYVIQYDNSTGQNVVKERRILVTRRYLGSSRRTA